MIASKEEDASRRERQDVQQKKGSSECNNAKLADNRQAGGAVDGRHCCLRLPEQRERGQ